MANLFNWKPLTLAVCMAVASISVNAEIKVYDKSVEGAVEEVNDAVSSAAKANTQDIATQTKALMQSIDLMTKALGVTMARTEADGLKAERSLEIGRQYSVDVKSRAACDEMRASSVRQTTTSPAVAAAIAQYAASENRRLSELPSGEPRDAYVQKEVFSRLIKDEEAIKSVTAFRDEPVDQEELDEVLERVAFGMNPIPQHMHSEEDRKLIEEHGNPVDKDRYMRVLVQSDRIARMQQPILERKQMDARSIPVKMLEQVLKGIDPEAVKSIADGDMLSQNQLDALLKTHRIKSSVWRIDANSKDSRWHEIESTIIQAEQLDTLYKIERALDQLIKISAQAEANRLAQAQATDN